MLDVSIRGDMVAGVYIGNMESLSDMEVPGNILKFRKWFRNDEHSLLFVFIYFNARTGEIN